MAKQNFIVAKYVRSFTGDDEPYYSFKWIQYPEIIWAESSKKACEIVSITKGWKSNNTVLDEYYAFPVDIFVIKDDDDGQRQTIEM